MTLQTKLMDARFEGREEGREETIQDVIQGMYRARMDLSVIAQITHRSVQEVRECVETLGGTLS